MRILRAIGRWCLRTWRAEAPRAEDLVDGLPGTGPEHHKRPDSVINPNDWFPGGS